MRRVLCVAALALACTPTIKTSCEVPANRVQLLAQARYLPELDGPPTAIRITAVGADSFLACLGVRDDERIVEFNHKPIREAADVAQFFKEFGAARALHLVVKDDRGKLREIVNE